MGLNGELTLNTMPLDDIAASPVYVDPFPINPDPEENAETQSDQKTCTCESSAASAEGKVDSAGIRYHGKVLEGLVKPSDARLRASTRGNPLDPYNLAQEILARETLG